MEQSLDLLLEKYLGTINFVSFIEQSPVKRLVSFSTMI